MAKKAATKAKPIRRWFAVYSDGSISSMSLRSLEGLRNFTNAKAREFELVLVKGAKKK